MTANNRGLLIVLGLAVVVILTGLLLAGGMMGPGMMWGYGVPAHGNGWTWGLGMGLGWLAMLAFWGALIAGGVLLARWITDRPTGERRDDREDAIAILRRRYASGEIDRATYERMKEDLSV